MYSDGELPSQEGSELRDRLAARRAEIKQVTLTRVYAIDDPSAVADPEYSEGLRRAVSELIDFAIEAIVGQRVPVVPVSLYSQASLAARNGISFSVVMKRYLAGLLALSEAVDEEAEADQAAALRRRLNLLLEDLIEDIDGVYSREVGHGALSRELRRAKLAKELLAGKPVDTDELAPGFNFDLWHTGLIATGASAADIVRRLARDSDRRLLQICPGEHSVWAWLAGKRKLEPTSLDLLATGRLPDDGCLALGEPCEGLAGWRLTHHQGAAALAVGLRRGDRIVCYGEVPMQASLLQDPVLSASLRQRYLAPLDAAPDGGVKARETLRAYFSRNRSISSAAPVLRVTRQTVSDRLRAIEKRLDCNDLHACASELEAALDLDLFDRPDHEGGEFRGLQP